MLILDEPTAVLTPQEIDELLRVVRPAARRTAWAIIMITHKLKEVLSIADRVSVLRRGEMVGTVERTGQTEESLARMMVGRDVLLRVDKTESVPERPVLQVSDLWVKDDRELDAVRGASFEVHAGEIVAVAGIDGNGQEELIDAIAGLRPIERGRIVLDGEDVTGLTPHEVSRGGARPHPAGPAPPRARARLRHPRERDPARLGQARHGAPRRDRPGGERGARGAALRDVRRALGRGHRVAIGLAVGWQPAEARDRTRDPARSRSC